MEIAAPNDLILAYPKELIEIFRLRWDIPLVSTRPNHSCPPMCCPTRNKPLAYPIRRVHGGQIKSPVLHLPHGWQAVG